MPTDTRLTMKSVHGNGMGVAADAGGNEPRPGRRTPYTNSLPFGVERRNLLFILLVLAAAGLFRHPLLALLSLSQEQEHYSHVVLIPFVSLFAFYRKRSVILSSKEWSPWAGLSVMGAGGWVYWSYGTATLSGDHLTLSIMSFVVMLWGAFLFLFGMSVCRMAVFGLLILVFIVPFPTASLSAIIGFLQRNSAEASDLLFSFLGVPVYRDGFVFSLTNFTIHVAEECSGIRSALSLFIVSIVAGHLFLRSFWAQLGLASIVIPLAIIKNAFRIVGLAVLANYVDPSFITDSILHRSGGVPLFLLSLAALFMLVWLFRRCEERFYHYSPDGLRVKT